MNWKGKESATVGDVMGAITKITDRAEAQEFMSVYRAENPHAGENIGYLTGYLDADEGARIRDLFVVSHPVFGNTEPTPQEAFAMGQKACEVEA